jgi:hypothetical protein
VEYVTTPVIGGDTLLRIPQSSSQPSIGINIITVPTTAGISNHFEKTFYQPLQGVFVQVGMRQ